MGKYIPEEEFHKILNDINNNLYKPNDPFPFENMNPSPHKMKPIEFEQGNIYEGEWNENFEMDGYGKYLLKEENVLAEGIWEKGELKRGRIFYPNGEFYEGEILNSSYNGKGITSGPYLNQVEELKNAYTSGNVINSINTREKNEKAIYQGSSQRDMEITISERESTLPLYDDKGGNMNYLEKQYQAYQNKKRQKN